jgi:aminotransferase
MNNIAGAIGLAQMEKLPGFLARRRAIYERYCQELADLAWLRLPPLLPEDCESSYYFCWLQTDARDHLAKYLIDNGVYSTFRYWPLHRVAFFSVKFENVIDEYPNAENACRRTLNIPLHQSLSDDNVSKIIGLIRNFKG